MAGILVADGGRGFTRGSAAGQRSRQILLHIAYTVQQNLPLTVTSCSRASGSPLTGSVPLSCTHLVMSLRSKTRPEAGDTTGSSGTSWQTETERDRDKEGRQDEREGESKR